MEDPSFSVSRVRADRTRGNRVGNRNNYSGGKTVPLPRDAPPFVNPQGFVICALLGGTHCFLKSCRLNGLLLCTAGVRGSALSSRTITRVASGPRKRLTKNHTSPLRFF